MRGEYAYASSWLSNPVTNTSSGTRIPCLFKTLINALALLSLAHIKQSGSGRLE